ncbi:hypothetical protein [Sorangium sp. So ce341]|uniref:hypothetical protein n=1 Tax=Sorangium sp. So ce341 TaxID=3133302 RepID=UPI003F6473C7
MGAELEHGSFELTNRYTRAFLEHRRALLAASPPASATPVSPPPGPAPAPPKTAPAPRRPAPSAPSGTAPLPDLPALVAALPFAPAPEKRPAPATAPTEPIAARAAPALSLEHYAALCAELSLLPRSAAAIYPRYGLRDVAAWQAADAAWQLRMRSDPALEARWQQLVAHFRAYYRAR